MLLDGLDVDAEMLGDRAVARARDELAGDLGLARREHAERGGIEGPVAAAAHDVDAIGDAQAVEDRREVALDRAARQNELVGDLLIA